MNRSFNSGLLSQNTNADTATGTPTEAPYPVEKLPRILRDAVLESHHFDQVPIELIAPTAIGIAGIIVPALACLLKPNGKKIWPQLFTLIVADTGEGKTPVAERFAEPLMASDEASDLEDHEAIIKYKAELRRWKAKSRALDKMITKLYLDGQPSDHMHAELEDHEQNKPIEPRPSSIIFDDITSRAFIDALQGKGQLAAFIADEGRRLMKSGAFRQLDILDKSWDGGTIRLHRANGESAVARSPHVSIILMIQRRILDLYLKSHGEEARGGGSMARYLVTVPPSMKGRRVTPAEIPEWIAVKALHARIKALEAKLKRMIAEGTNNPVAIELDDDAIELLGNFERQLESHIKLGGDLSDIDDFASKASQNACRLAVVFYVLTEQTGKLNYDMLIRAITIVISSAGGAPAVNVCKRC